MVIIYGGSFNPPTIAHYEIAKYIINLYPGCTFYFLPTNDLYNKYGLVDFKIRIKMLEIVCGKLDNLASVSDFEGEFDQYYGTYYTLSHFNNPYFVMGADNLETISSWINYPKIIKDFKFIIIPRNNINIDKIFIDNEELKKYKSNFIVLDNFSEVDLSSSYYRKTRKSNLVLKEVEQFIKDNNLYKELICTTKDI